MFNVYTLLVSGLVAGLTSGAVISSIVSLLFHRRNKRIEEEIKTQFEKSITIFQSTRLWKEQSTSELLGPLHMHFDRTSRAFKNYNKQNLYLEQKVIYDSNLKMRDMLLAKPHLIPHDLREDAGNLIEHFDRWLEKFARVRDEQKPELSTEFVFVGPDGFPFPKQSEQAFKNRFAEVWRELYMPRNE